MLRKLRASVEAHGVLVPLVVRPLGRGEHAVVDGSRRVQVLRDLGLPGSTEVPALVLEGDDAQALVAQVQINQVRDRLSSLAEAEALRALVRDQGWQAQAAAKALGRSKPWASRVLKVFQLPPAILRDLRGGRIALAHARVLCDHATDARLLRLLHREAASGQVSKRQLSVLGKRIAREGAAATRLRPRRHALGERSWVRLEPLLEGVRAEVHLDDRDAFAACVRTLAALLRAARRRTPPIRA